MLSKPVKTRLFSEFTTSQNVSIFGIFTAQSLPLRISAVNVTKPAVSSGFGHIS